MIKRARLPTLSSRIHPSKLGVNVSVEMEALMVSSGLDAPHVQLVRPEYSRAALGRG